MTILTRNVDAVLNDNSLTASTLDRTNDDAQYYYRLFKHSPVMMFSINQKNLICEVNDRWLIEMQYRREEIIGTSIENYLCEDSRESAIKSVFPKFWRTGNINGVNYRLITKYNTIIDILLNCTMIKIDSKFIGICAAQNITEQNALIKKLHETVSGLEHFKIIKKQFAANLDCELRTPLTNIIGFADMLGMTDASTEQNKLLNHIKTNCSELFITITSLLEYSKIESNEIILESIEFSFKKLILESINHLMPEAKEKNIKIFYSIDSSLKYNLLGDESKIKLIILNLIDNAINFSDGGEIKITLSVQSETSETAVIKFEISDTGAGISTGNIDKIFLPFFQDVKSLSRKNYGMGLGLTISKYYVEMMGGDKIHVESTEGSGSKFYFSLYLAKTAIPKKKEEKNGAITNLEIKKNDYYIGRKVLIVEDNYLNIELICRLLKICECNYEIVENGAKAIELIKKGTAFDAILMDINLPDINGIEVTQKLRDSGCKMPIIALTAYTSRCDKLNCLNAGMNDYLTKPINFTCLVDSLKKQCGLE